MSEGFDRRAALKLGAATTMAFGLGFWKQALAAPALVGPGPYGRLQPVDSLGIRLPAGFSARALGVTGQPVAPSGFDWIGAPDGAATFGTGDGGWVYAANSELAIDTGGVAAMQFSATGEVVDAYRILSGTSRNCSGGATPWGTWLSGEEVEGGLVFECNPFAASEGVAHPLLGAFRHEAAVVDPSTGYVYLTEDEVDGRLYRFRPDTYGDLSSGALEAAKVNRAGDRLRWVAASTSEPARGDDSTAFHRGEGAWFSGGRVYFCTTGDNRVWSLRTSNNALQVVYDADVLGADAPLRRPDGITVHQPSGDLFVAEGADNLEIVILARRPARPKRRVAAPFARLVGHPGSEITGLAFSPDGTRLYGSSQRGTDGVNGITFEITGPFRVLTT